VISAHQRDGQQRETRGGAFRGLEILLDRVERIADVTVVHQARRHIRARVVCGQ
jgi:hypothetical protein